MLVAVVVSLLLLYGGNVDCLSTKKGYVHYYTQYECGDFDAFSNVQWWYDYAIGTSVLIEPKERELGCSTPADSSKHVPMIWGAAATEQEITGSSDYVLAFNEPTHKNQANLTPKDACDLWDKVKAQAGDRTIVCPAAAECGQDCVAWRAQDWLKQFFDICPPTSCDVLNAHTYMCDADAVMKYLSTLHLNFGKNIWLTEFACAKVTDPIVQLVFMQTLLPKLEDAYFVDRYSWYSVRQKTPGYVTESVSLLEPDSPTKTMLGEFYDSYDGSSTVEIYDIYSHDFQERFSKDEIAWGGKEFPASEVEVLKILVACTEYPCTWWKVLNTLLFGISDLPTSTQAYYVSTERFAKKRRVSAILKEVMCNEKTKPNEEIKTEIQRIQTLKEGSTETKGLKYDCSGETLKKGKKKDKKIKKEKKRKGSKKM